MSSPYRALGLSRTQKTAAATTDCTSAVKGGSIILRDVMAAKNVWKLRFVNTKPLMYNIHYLHTAANMQNRRAAFALLRRIALSDFAASTPSTAAAARAIPKFTSPSCRSLHIRATPRLLDSSADPSSATYRPISIPKPSRPVEPATSPAPQDAPAYELTFTCKPCLTRSSHRVSKQGYHHGSVLIMCPECKNRHIISDHLGVRPFLPFFISTTVECGRCADLWK
jgi:hypothetical protein